MTKPYMSEDDIKNFETRLEATISLGETHDIHFKRPAGTTYNPFDLITALAVERLDKSSKTLNRLTKALIVLTSVLAAVGIANIFTM